MISAIKYIHMSSCHRRINTFDLISQENKIPKGDNEVIEYSIKIPLDYYIYASTFTNYTHTTLIMYFQNQLSILLWN